MSLFIGRLPLDNFDARDLYDIFSKYGTIIDHKMKYGTIYGYGFVTYEHTSDMHEAIHKEDGRYIDGQNIIVEKAFKGIDAISCFHCGRKGHLARFCRNNNRSYYRYDDRYDDDYSKRSYNNDAYERPRRNYDDRRRYSDDKRKRSRSPSPLDKKSSSSK